MTEIEKIERAKLYLAKLANGIDPITDLEMPADSMLNNVRLSRCFFYVSDILLQVIENGGTVGTGKRAKKADFMLTEKQLSEIPFSKVPVGITNFVALINSLINEHEMKKLSALWITAWLVDKGYLAELTDPYGNKRKMPTEEGNYIGLTAETRQGMRGEYTMALYSEEAQRFVIDHLDAILQSYREKKS
ncbi:MAG TPA: hypothetical protein VN441_05555 [Syntrophomonas sp.]|nr:hypothetical protein [Syntrophomonas sp.]